MCIAKLLYKEKKKKPKKQNNYLNEFLRLWILIPHQPSANFKIL